MESINDILSCIDPPAVALKDEGTLTCEKDVRTAAPTCSFNYLPYECEHETKDQRRARKVRS